MPLGIPDWVEPYIGLPYVKGGRNLKGVDCIGLFLLVEREHFGVEIEGYDGPDWSGRRDVAAVAEAARAFAARFKEIDAGSERVGDAILLRMTGQPIHIGCVIAPGLMLHIEEECDSVVEDYTTRAWANRIVAFHRAEPA